MFESGLAFVLFKGLLGFGLPLAFAVQQLWSLRRDERAARAKATAEIVPLQPAAAATSAPPERRAA
jgi:hypothetical protein